MIDPAEKKYYTCLSIGEKYKQTVKPLSAWISPSRINSQHELPFCIDNAVIYYFGIWFSNHTGKEEYRKDF